MKDGKRKVLNILKKVAYICAAFLAIAIVLAVALAISKILFYILLYAVYAIVAFVIIVLGVKMLLKIFQYIERWKKKK